MFSGNVLFKSENERPQGHRSHRVRSVRIHAVTDKEQETETLLLNVRLCQSKH